MDCWKDRKNNNKEVRSIKMKAYSIFDDFTKEAIEVLEKAGIDLTVHPLGVPRPNHDQMKVILEQYDIVIIGTSQKIMEDMFDNIADARIIATASVGVDHIKIPGSKAHLVSIINTPNANTQSVAEYNIGAMLTTRKRIIEGNALYAQGLDNKKLVRKPEDIHGTTVGFVGAGRISGKTMELLYPFGVNILCYSDDADQRQYLTEQFGVKFVSLEELARESDIISVNVPNTPDTYHLISSNLVESMKEDCIFISIAREQVVDIPALINKANVNPNFYTVLDLDVIPDYVGKNNTRNIIITPHIAGGTIETRKRMFKEVSQGVVTIMKG